MVITLFHITIIFILTNLKGTSWVIKNVDNTYCWCTCDFYLFHSIDFNRRMYMSLQTYLISTCGFLFTVYLQSTLLPSTYYEAVPLAEWCKWLDGRDYIMWPRWPCTRFWRNLLAGRLCMACLKLSTRGKIKRNHRDTDGDLYESFTDTDMGT